MSKLSRRTIIKKTAMVGLSTLFSRLLGVVREVLKVRYLGAGAMADAFNMAFKIPNTLRKVFAEGALSASFIPTLVAIQKKDEHDQVNKLMSLMFIVFEGFLLALCFLIFWKASFIVSFLAPGFVQAGADPERFLAAVKLTRITIFFIFFVSSSALCAGALQSIHQFFIPTLGPILLNISFIAGLIISLYYKLPVEQFALFVLFGGVLQLLLHIFAYLKNNFSVGVPDQTTWKNFRTVLFKFLPCLLSMSAIEINLTIDQMLASYLPVGSISLLTYAFDFTRIALGVFAVAFSTVLLPHFSRVNEYAPKRLSFYLLESTKLIFWVTVPVAIIMSFFSHKIFYTILYCDNFPIEKVIQAASILSAFLVGLFFFSLNKILLSIYYSKHSTFLPTVISFVGTAFNTILNLILIKVWGVYGLAIATSSAAALQSALFIYMLHKRFKFQIYIKNFLEFIFRYTVQLSAIGLLFYLIYLGLNYLILYFMSEFLSYYLLETVLFWTWVAPLVAAMFGLIYLSRKFFKVKIYFLN